MHAISSNGRTRALRKGGSLLLLLFVTSILPACASQAPTRVHEMTAQEWKGDLDYLARRLPELHAEPFRRVSEEEFRAEVAKVGDELVALQDHEVMVELMRLAAMLRDGHTAVVPALEAAPIVPYFFAGQLYIVATDREHEALLGCEVRRVNGLPVSEVVTRLAPIIDRDNNAEIPRKAAAFMRYPKILAARQVGANRDSLVLELGGNLCEPVAGKAEVGAQPQVDEWVFLLDRELEERPLYEQQWTAGRTRSFYWGKWLPDSSALYVQYNTSRNQPGRKSFAEFSREVLEELEKRDHPVLIVDVRHNTGGNFEIANLLVRRLGDPEVKPKQIYVLTSRNTGSAATVLAAKLVVQHGAKVFGEQSRSNPNFTYNAESFQLPNSGLKVEYTQATHEPFPQLGDEVPVDVVVESTFEDYVTGRDPVLDAVFGQLE